MRADVYLTEKGLSPSRSRAKADIESGRLFVNGKQIFKAGFDIGESDTVTVEGDALPYVGRGGLKLLGALEAFGALPVGSYQSQSYTPCKTIYKSGEPLTVRDKICVDVGASTGGFTDCLLQNGAKKVYAVDCGSGQLAPSLADDLRVVNLENTNARELSSALKGVSCDLAVMDVSFISQTLLYPAVHSVLTERGELVSLIKPQFEAGKAGLGKKGVVRSPDVRERVLREVTAQAKEAGFYLTGVTVSPIQGGDGNVEYLARFSVQAEKEMTVSKTEWKLLAK